MADETLLTSFGSTECAQTIQILILIADPQMVHVHWGHIQKGIRLAMTCKCKKKENLIFTIFLPPFFQIKPNSKQYAAVYGPHKSFSIKISLNSCHILVLFLCFHHQFPWKSTQWNGHKNVYNNRKNIKSCYQNIIKNFPFSPLINVNIRKNVLMAGKENFLYF